MQGSQLLLPCPGDGCTPGHPLVLQRRTREWPWNMSRQKAIPGRACPAQMAHQVAWRPAALHALPYPGPPSWGKPVVVMGRQGLASAPSLQLSVPHRCRCCTTRCNLLLVAHCHQDDTKLQPASCPGMRGGLPQGAARPCGLPCGDWPCSGSAVGIRAAATLGTSAALGAARSLSRKDRAHLVFLLFADRRVGLYAENWAYAPRHRGLRVRFLPLVVPEPGMLECRWSRKCWKRLLRGNPQDGHLANCGARLLPHQMRKTPRVQLLFWLQTLGLEDTFSLCP